MKLKKLISMLQTQDNGVRVLNSKLILGIKTNNNILKVWHCMYCIKYIPMLQTQDNRALALKYKLILDIQNRKYGKFHIASMN